MTTVLSNGCQMKVRPKLKLKSDNHNLSHFRHLEFDYSDYLDDFEI